MKSYIARSVARKTIPLLIVGGLVGLFISRPDWLARGLRRVFLNTLTMTDILTGRQELKEAIANLTQESQIGSAKVLSQETRDGKLRTRIRFVETERDDLTRRSLQKEFDIEGDVAHFDALIVKFSNQLVMDGKERSLYLWRRIYGEQMTPEQGYPIESPGSVPARYTELTSKLPLDERNLFWSEIWKLADQPDRLRDLGIQAIYGNVVYRKLRPGLLYIFKITNTGQIIVEPQHDPS